ncbi:MAG: HAMP domain-containing histidine kinase [Alphaproteobacteria bacterium]|nr:HAMP domain-containing histidine kinase [Alphaproteobacteria bacterium]
MTVPQPFGIKRDLELQTERTADGRRPWHGTVAASAQKGAGSEIRFEQLGQTLSSSIYAVTLEAAAALLIVLGLGGLVPPAALATWFLLVWGLAAARAMLWYRYKRWFISADSIGQAQALLVCVSAASGLLWGGALVFLWPFGANVHQVFLVMTAAAIAAASSGLMLSHLPSLMVFIGAGLLTVVLGYPRNGGDSLYGLIAGFALPYALILGLVARHINSILVKSHMLRLELASAKEEAQVASRAKSEFISSISHELRTPLNAVIGFSEIMMQQMFGPIGNAQYLDYTKDIHRSGSHLLAIINDILDLTKIEAGKMVVHESVVDVSEVVTATVSILRDSADKAGLEVDCRWPEPAPRIKCDERLLKQMLLNLISNAIKFTPIGGKVSVTVERTPGRETLIVVQDTGIGIAPDDMELVMQAFGQVEGAMTRQHSGTGLGLPLVKAMAELHGARFELQSTVDVGTTATLRFAAASAA